MTWLNHQIQVCDAGPTFNRHWPKVACLLGSWVFLTAGRYAGNLTLTHDDRLKSKKIIRGSDVHMRLLNV